MPLKIDDLEIEDKNLIGFVIDNEMCIHFRGRALDDEGERICKKLSEFKIGSTVEVTLVSLESGYHKQQGIYELFEMVIPPREEKDRIIYRFSGKLRPVH